MAAAELTHPTSGDRRALTRTSSSRRPGSELVVALATVWALTAIGALVGFLAHGLAPGSGPHPTLHGNAADVLSLLATNVRLLSVPFALALLGFQRSRHAQRFGDLLVSTIVTLNAIRVGLAFGRYGTRLIPYIPQLPIEWLALALSTSAWISIRRGAPPRALRTSALLTLLVAAIAAAIEALLTPHAR